MLELFRKLFSSRVRGLEAANLRLEKEISEYKRREEEMRKFSSLVENSPDFIGIASLHGEVLFLNPAARALVGLTRDEPVGAAMVLEHVAERDLERFQNEALPAVYRDGRWEGETVFRNVKTGASISMWQIIFFITEETSGRRLALATISRDITERKRGEEEMRKLASLVENSTDFIGMGSLEGDVLFLNSAAQNLVGVTGDQFRGTRIVEYVTEHDRERFVKDVLPVVFKDSRWEGETVFRHMKTGSPISMWQYIFFITEEGSGRRLAMATICRDITERKRSEERLHDAQAQLAHMARLTSLGEIAASIAHEVNQPLAGIVTNGNACLRWLSRPDPDLDRARMAVDRIVKDGSRAGEVINGIRALARKTNAQQERLDVNQVIEEVVALVQPEVRRNNVALQTYFADNLPAVLGDRVQLQQVVLNLVINGIEAMKPVEGWERKLVIRTRPGEDGQVRVAVQDSGIGLDPENIDRIFDAFYTTKEEGMGMGLSISRSIIERHNGWLWAASNDGPGATFEFTLADVHLGEITDAPT